MTDWRPDYEDGRVYSGPVIDRGILGENDVPETFASKLPYFYVTRTEPLKRGEAMSPDAPLPSMNFTKWLYEWHEERGGWLFMGRS